MKKKSAQAGVIHLALVVVLIAAGVLGYYIYKIPQLRDQKAEAASNKGTFTNLSAILKSDNATFNFSYSGSTGSYRIDVATSSNMRQNLYSNFGSGSSSPIIVSSPQSKWGLYKCSSTVYWVINTVNGQIKSPVQTSIVDCTPTPTPTPSSTPSTATCSWTTDGVCPSNCAAGSDADCCTQKGYYILQANLFDTPDACAPGCYPTNYTPGTTACMTCSVVSDGACPNWCAAGSDNDCCTQAGKQWIVGQGCY